MNNVFAMLLQQMSQLADTMHILPRLKLGMLTSNKLNNNSQKIKFLLTFCQWKVTFKILNFENEH